MLLTLQHETTVEFSSAFMQYAHKLNSKEFTCSELDLFRLRCLIEEEEDSRQKRQMAAALNKALDGCGGWQYINGYTIKYLTKDGQPYSLPEARFYRSVWKDLDRKIAYIETRDKSGNELLALQIPSGAHCPAGYWLQKRLEAEGDLGWVFNDTSDWSSFDHLFSHGH